MSKIYFEELLHERKLKATSTRVNLLLAMQKFKSAMPYSAIQKSLKSLDRVTLYRTLEAFKENGIIHKAYQENNEIYYAICDQRCGIKQHEHDHIHVKCEKCLSVTCQKMDKQLTINIPDFQASKISIQVEGICKSCR